MRSSRTNAVRQRPGGLALAGAWAVAVAVASLIAAFAAPALAQNQPGQSRPAPSKPAQKQPLREIFVPFDDLNVILEGDVRRVFLSREQYEELLAKAKKSPEARAPLAAAVLAAEYDASIADGRALITGVVELEVLQSGLHAVPLELAGVGVRSAQLDDGPAPLARDPQGRVLLFMQGTGRHKLTLDMTAPLAVAAAQQTLQLQLPLAPASRLRVSVAGNVEVKSGAAVASRSFDEAANLTRLELLPQRAPISVVMSLNNRLLREQRVVVTRSVLVDEVTQGYERLHATVTQRVLHGAVDKFRFAVPAGFEVTEVSSPLLARWQVQAENGRQVLEATLREPTTETVVLAISAVRSPPALDQWTFPRLESLDVASQIALVGLLVEDRLRPEQLAATGLLPIDAAVLASAIPASVLNAEPGAPAVRQVSTYYAPAADYALSARFARPAARLLATASALLVLEDQQLTIRGGFALTPEAEEVFRFRFTAPAGWRVTEVTQADGSPLPFERYDEAQGGATVAVSVPGGLPMNQATSVNFQAVAVPAAWLADWNTQTVEFPQFAVVDAARPQGAIAVHALDDLEVRPEKLENLAPLLEQEKANYGFAGLPTTLAYRYEGDYSAVLQVRRTEASLTAEAFSFFRLEPDNLVAHYELAYDVRQARARRLIFSLPASTPEEVAIRGLDGVAVKEFLGQVAGDRRLWTVSLAERQSGRLRLAVDFQQRLGQEELKGHVLPLIAAEQVEYQTGAVAVEGSAELDVEVVAAPRKVDVGELAAAEYQPGRRLIGAFGYAGSEAELKVDVQRQPLYPLPPALVQRAELVTLVDVAGRCQTAARYHLKTKATSLEIQLPPGAELWTAYLDGQPTRPQTDQGRLLLSLPVAGDGITRNLQLVYQQPVASLSLAGQIQVPAPRLLLHDRADAPAREVQAADVQWELLLPPGYRVRRSDGNVTSDQLPRYQLAAVKVGRFLLWLGGGVGNEHAELRNELKQIGAVFELESKYSLAPTAKSAAPSAGEAHYADEPLATRAAPPQSAPASPEDPFAPGMPPPPVATPKPAEPALPQSEAMPTPDAPPAPADRPTPGFFRDVDKLAKEAAALAERTKAEMDDFAAKAGDKAGQFVDQRRFWALEGISSLPIELQRPAEARVVTFRGLGTNPELGAALVNTRRVAAAAVGLALVVLLVGFSLTRQPGRVRWTFVALVLLGATLPPLLLEALDEVRPVFDFAFYAGSLLAAYYLLVSACRCCCSLACCVLAPRAATAPVLLALVACLALTGPALAQPAEIKNIQDLLPLLDLGGPVKVPADAIIIPYDASVENGVAKADRILVPYDKYVELWNQAYPDKPLGDPKLPALYALAGARYEATLGDGEELTLRGTLSIDVFSDKPVAIPLPLRSAVLAAATLDGATARLQFVEPQPAAVNEMPNAPAQQAGKAQQAQPAGKPAPADPIVLLHVQGKGRKQLEITLRLPVTRQGGWRIASARVPAAPATSLTLAVPTEKTEVRLSGLPDKLNQETKAAGEKIETALGADGQLGLQWRPHVTEGQVDQSLTADSLAVFDVREDALRLAWRLSLDFRRGARESFTLSVPADYLVEQVAGDNIRGWQAKTQDGRQLLDVTLLKAATGRESLVVFLSRSGRVGEGALAEFPVPAVGVVDAALEQGQVLIRRSPRLELRTGESAGVSRVDAPSGVEQLTQLTDAADASVLVVRPFQAYRFTSVPFTLRLSAQPQPSAATAQVRTLVRAAETKDTLEARILIRPSGQPVYRVRVQVPADFELESVGPAEAEWSLDPQPPGQLLTVHLPAGAESEFAVTFTGRLGKRAEPNVLAAPRLVVQDVQRQEGELVVQAEPAVDVIPEQVQNAEPLNQPQSLGWLQDVQRPLAKAGLRYRSPDYQARFRLAPRQPQVTVRTVSNVKLTRRAIEESLLLDFQIAQAGIHEVAFLLPADLRGARIKAPLLQRKILEPVKDKEGQPLDSLVRVRLQLQDDVLGQFRVLVEHDRLLAGGWQAAAIPVVETGETTARFVALENAGRDEVIVDRADGLESLGRAQQAWRELAALLGPHLTQAWLATGDVAYPQLVFHTKDRDTVATAGARIGLAETLLVFDAAGAYRGRQQYRLSNSTEQFLEVQLPADSRLWTAVVDGEPVKPIETSAADVVRIPLVKTAEGEGDYLVVLKYGGQLAPPGNLGFVRFPLIRTRNIKVELSQVRLLLPETHYWHNFGGAMRRVDDRDELTAGFQSYLNKQLEEGRQYANSANPFTQLRWQSNLKNLRILLDNSRSMSDGQSSTLTANEELLGEAERQIQQQQAAQQAELSIDNRGRLNDLYAEQSVNKAKGNLEALGRNFDAPRGETGQVNPSDQFNQAFLDQNRLSGLDPQSREPRREATAPGKSTQRFSRSGEIGEGKPVSGSGGVGGKDFKGPGQGQGPQVVSGKEREELRQQLAQQPANQPAQPNAQPQGDELNLGRYQQRLAQQQELQKKQFELPRGGGQRGAAQEEAGSYERHRLDANGNQMGLAYDGPLPHVLTIADGGLASLDIELPQRGQEFLFTTPLGDNEITARCVDRSVLVRLTSLLAVVVLVALVGVAGRARLPARLAEAASRNLLVALAFFLGLAMMVFGVLPLFGAVISLLSGLTLLSRFLAHLRSRRA